MTGPRGSRWINSKLAASSALPNTAGMTTVKQSVASKKKVKGVKNSAPL
jgi:hypothetical protein